MKAESSTSNGEYARPRVWAATALHSVALVAGALALEIALFGGLRFEVGDTLVSATTLLNPLVGFFTLTLLGVALVPRLGLGPAPLWWALRWLGVRSHKNRAAAGVLLVALAVQGSLRVQQLRHLDAADWAFARGLNDKAAMHFEKAELLLDPLRSRWRGRRADALFRAGRFEDSIAQVQPYFARGGWLERRGYRSLWRSYAALGRLPDAEKAMERAKTKHPGMARECDGALAELRRMMESGSREPRAVRLTFKPPSRLEGPLYVAGNWNADGGQSEIAGWNGEPMRTSDDGVTWTSELRLRPADVFQYVALVFEDESTLSAPAIGMAQLWVRPGTAPIGAAVTPLSKPDAPAPAQRREGSDGTKRVIALWPDAGAWHFVNPFARRGLLPNLGRMLSDGARAELTSTDPAYTSMAYWEMTRLDPSVGRQTGEGRSVFRVLDAEKRPSANLIFSDPYMTADNDLRMGDGTKINVDWSLPPGRDATIPEPRARSIMKDVLGVAADGSPRAAAILEERYFLLAAEGNEEKARIGLSVWRDQTPHFMLLRFPNLDKISHRFFPKVETSPEHNMLIEGYRHFDAIVGRFVAELDQDDTLIVVSDHAIRAVFAHDRGCLFIADGGGVAPGANLGTLPLAALPAMALARLGSSAGSERLSAQHLTALGVEAPR